MTAVSEFVLNSKRDINRPVLSSCYLLYYGVWQWQWQNTIYTHELLLPVTVLNVEWNDVYPSQYMITFISHHNNGSIYYIWLRNKNEVQFPLRIPWCWWMPEILCFNIVFFFLWYFIIFLGQIYLQRQITIECE